MKSCDRHWKMIRDAVDAAGMTALIPETGEAAAKALQAAMTEGTTSVDNFDPLMFAYMAIVAHAVELVGPVLFMDNDDGSEKCPQCYLTMLHARVCNDPECTTKDFDDWATHAVADAKAAWEGLRNV